MIIPHIRQTKSDDTRLSEEVRIAMKNVPYKPSYPMPFMPQWKVSRIFWWGIILYMFSASAILYWGEAMMAPRAHEMSQRIAAGIFILAVVVNFIVDFGWRGGGDKSK